MIVKEEFLSKLRRYFSLNLYEVKIWAALLSRGVSTAGELSDIANVPRSRSYDVLESLEKKGFVIMKLGKPIKYIAVPPTEVVERVKKNMREDAEEKVKRLEDLKSTDVLQELNSLHSQGVELVEPTDLSGSLRGRHNLYNHLELTIRNAEKNVNIMTTSQGFLRKAEGFKPTFEKIKKRGVSIRIAAPITKECKDAVKELAGVAEIKNIVLTILKNPKALRFPCDGPPMTCFRQILFFTSTRPEASTISKRRSSNLNVPAKTGFMPIIKETSATGRQSEFPFGMVLAGKFPSPVGTADMNGRVTFPRLNSLI